MIKKHGLSLVCFLVTAMLLSCVELFVGKQIIVLGRFFEYGAWFEIAIISFYAAFVASKMKDPAKVSVWRQRTWFLFTIIFFTQLLLGIIGYEKFLMTGKLHFPIPAMIISGPIFRTEISFMTILFLSTIILSGPSWCSHLCYFGAFDGLLAKGKTAKKPISNKFRYKHTILALVIAITLLLRLSGFELIFSIISAALFGIIGVFVIVLISRKKKKMIHCTVFCPVGTVVNYVKFVNPFRIRIDSSCTLCGHCSPKCKYDALNITDLKRNKPGLTCTYCGDCLTACNINSIQYKFFGFSPKNARNLYLIVSITIHAIFLALAKI